MFYFGKRVDISVSGIALQFIACCCQQVVLHQANEQDVLGCAGRPEGRQRP